MIFASHSPPDLPPSPVPSVQILRLASPLAVEDAGAARLASTLEWAERIARIWRASGSNNAGVLYYDEATKDVPLPRSGSFSRSFVQRCRSNSLSGPLFTGSLPPVNPSQRPFDAILNYISHGVTQKHVLKQTILVTSITRPFLAPTFSPYHRLSGVKRNSGQGLGSRAHSLSPAPPYQSGDLLATTARGVTATHPSASAVSPPCSHMVHIVPPTARTSLIRSLDLFLSSFSRQDFGPKEVGSAKQYVLSSSTMRELIHPRFDQGEHTVLDLVLFGGLDSVPGKSWIGSGQDIVFIPTSPSSSVSPSPPVPPKPIRSPSRTTSDSHQPASHPLTHVKSSHLPPPGSLTGSRRSEKRIPKQSGLVPERGGCALPNLTPHPDPIRYLSLQGPYRCNPPSLNLSSGRVQRPGLSKHNRPIDITSGLLTPPDSDEDTSTPPRPVVSKVPTPLSEKPKWRF